MVSKSSAGNQLPPHILATVEQDFRVRDREIYLSETEATEVRNFLWPTSRDPDGWLSDWHEWDSTDSVYKALYDALNAELEFDPLVVHLAAKHAAALACTYMGIPPKLNQGPSDARREEAIRRYKIFSLLRLFVQPDDSH